MKKLLFSFYVLCIFLITSFAEKELQVIEFTDEQFLTEYYANFFSMDIFDSCYIKDYMEELYNVPATDSVAIYNTLDWYDYYDIYFYDCSASQEIEIMPFGVLSNATYNLIPNESYYQLNRIYFSFQKEGLIYHEPMNPDIMFATVYMYTNLLTFPIKNTKVYFVLSANFHENRIDSLWIPKCYKETDCNVKFPLNMSNFFEIEDIKDSLIYLENFSDSTTDSTAQKSIHGMVFKDNQKHYFLYKKDTTYKALCVFDPTPFHYYSDLTSCAYYTDMKIGCFFSKNDWTEFDSLPQLKNKDNISYANTYASPYPCQLENNPIRKHIIQRNSFLPHIFQINGRKASNKNASGVYVSKDGAKVELKK